MNVLIKSIFIKNRMINKKHILFFIESLSGGGAERVLVTMLKHFDYVKYDITLLTLVDDGVLRDEIMEFPIRYMTVIRPSNKPWLKILNKIKYKLIYHWLPTKLVNRWIIPQNNVDVYVAFAEGFATKLISYSFQKKITWVHIDLKSYPWTLHEHIYRNLQDERNTYNKYNKVICVSKSVEEVMRDYYKLSNTCTIYNPIDIENIRNKAELDVDVENSSSFKIVSVGRLVPQKGYDKLIPVIAELRKEGYDINLYIIGEGSERNKLEQLISICNLSESVHLLGFLKNPFPVLKKMDLFVCSSRAEGFSLVIAEAMVLGLPVVSMNCAGPNELLDGGKYGLLCDNYRQFYYEIKRVISSPELLMSLSLKSKEGSFRFQIHDTLNAVYREIEM